MKDKLTAIVLILLAAIGIGWTIKHTLSESLTTETVEEHDDFERGPHRGRLLQDENFQTEITIYEKKGIPPKFRIYFYDNGKPINPSEVNFRMQLERIDRTETIPFRQVENYLESTIEAKEPHSFKIKTEADYRGKTYSWEYESYEGRVELSQEAVKANSIKIEKAEPAVLKMTLNVPGKLVPNEENTLYISPRFPGVVKEVFKKLGDSVAKGETLAVIESNESLQNYDIKSEIAGTIIKKNINNGMYLSGQESIFIISDLRILWADFTIYRRDLAQVKLGDSIEIRELDGNVIGNSTISYISPIGHEGTQSIVARALLDNPNETLKPGLFVSGEITVDNVAVNVAVKDTALQTFRDWDVVFLVSGNLFEVVPVEIGRRNKDLVEITSGLSPGDSYVTENSYILKADLEKSSAEHDH